MLEVLNRKTAPVSEAELARIDPGVLGSDDVQNGAHPRGLCILTIAALFGRFIALSYVLC
jgi:hypothetical protein